MKRLSDLLKPFLSVIFGALLFLVYFNWLGFNGWPLALGIVAVSLAVFYITVGLLGSLLGEKFPKKSKDILDAIGVVAFPTFLGVYFLVSLILSNTGIGPMGWTVSIFSILAALGLACSYMVAYFGKVKMFFKATFLFASLFVLALLLDVLLTNGYPETLGNIVILGVVLYAVYTAILFNNLKAIQEEYKKLSKPKEEPKEDNSKK